MVDNLKVCEICGATEEDKRVVNSGKHNMVVCEKHYAQLQQNGKILDYKKRCRNDLNEIIKHEEYAEICLYNIRNKEVGRVKIDLEDINKVKNYKWSLNKQKYPRTTVNKKHISLHCFVMGNPKNKIIDHINHDVLDCRKENLRICTQSENMMNQKLREDNKSGYTGVFWHKDHKKWVAHITIKGKTKHLGYFDNKEDTIKARKEAEKKYFGKFRYKKGE